MNSYGCSLPEVLVVIAILVVLFGVCLPVYHQTLELAQRTNCQYNLKQLGIAFHLYSYDHAGSLPHSDRDSDTGPNHCWFDVLDRYLDKSNLAGIKQCPGWDGYSTQHETQDEHSIKMNGGLCPNERPYESAEDQKKHHWYWPKLWDIPKKTATVLLVDGRMDSPYHTHTETRSHQGFYDVANRHQGGANVLSVGGTVSWVPAEEKGFANGEIGWEKTGGLIWEPYQKP